MPNGGPVLFVHADWHKHGLCHRADPDLWFPTRGEEAAHAKEVCTVCPYRAPCLEEVLARNEQYGVWGGLSTRERKRLRRARREGEAA